MATNPNATQITPPRVPIIDERTGAVSREWYRWFYSLYNITGGGTAITPVANGGTGLSTIPTNGQLLIGNGAGYTLNTLGAGVGISVTNGLGTIVVSNTGVLSFSGGTTGLTPITATTGAVTLAGILAIANGGTNGSATPTAYGVAYGTGTAYAFTAAGTTKQALLANTGAAPTWSTLTTGSSILYGDGSGGFNNVTIGSGVSFVSGTLSATGVSGTALTRTNDTNVTVTLSGSPTTALLNATRLTMGWSGTLATTRGGTGLGSFTANGVMYASSTSVLVTGSDFVFDGTNLGIGTASPTNKLSVNGNVPAASAASFVSASLGSIAAGFSDNVNASFYIRPAVGGVVLGTDAGGTIRFATNGNATTDEKMQITSAGGVSFGSTGTAYGTVGQVLTSAGNAPPTWTTPTTANLTGAITSIGTATSLGSFTSAELRAAVTDETGTGSLVFATSPTLVTPDLGTPSALVGTNITGTANSLNAGFGVNQTWQAPARAIGITYTNSSGKPIMVSVSYTCTNANTVQGLIIAGTTVYAGAVNVATFAGAFSLVVPDGATYVTTTNAGTLTLVSWAELRL